MAVILTTFDCLYHFKSNEDGIRNIGLYSFACGSPDNSTIFDSWIRQVISSPTGSRSLLQVFAAEQLAVPCLDLMIYIIIIVHLIVTKGFRLSQKASYVLLVPPFSLFAIVEVTVSRFFSILRFQGSSVLGIFFLTSKMKMSSALVAKRIINIVFLPAYFSSNGVISRWTWWRRHLSPL